MIKLLMLLLLISHAMGGESTIPTEAQRCVDAYNADVAKAFAAYNEAVAKAAARQQSELKKIQDKLTREAKLEAALAVKGIGEKLQSGELLAAAEERARDPLLDPKKPALLTIVSATWGVANKSIDLAPFLTRQIDRKTNSINFLINGYEIDKIVGDPAVGFPKTATITYKFGNGQPTTVTLQHSQVFAVSPPTTPTP
jgi:hypothetical protein